MALVADNVSASREEHERGLALFVAPSRRDRFRESLRDPRRRRKLRAELWHFENRLDERFARELEQHTKHEHHVEHVHALLLDRGAPATCCVLSADGDDGDAIALRLAVAQLMTEGAGFISCIPGRLGLYVGEDGSGVFLLTHES